VWKEVEKTPVETSNPCKCDPNDCLSCHSGGHSLCWQCTPPTRQPKGSAPPQFGLYCAVILFAGLWVLTMAWLCANIRPNCGHFNMIDRTPGYQSTRQPD
jgi:hypothetical protein